MSMLHNVQTRWQAFGIHLLSCLIIFVVVAALILLEWYPDYFRYFGGLLGLGLIAGIDLVLGPTLTLIVFDRKKKYLKWDLVAIGLFQLSALGYGIWSVYQGRPVAQVLTHEGVHILTLSDINSYQVDIREIEKMGNDLPIRVFLDLPKDLGQIKQVELITGITEQKPIFLRLDLYREFRGESSFEIETLLSLAKFEEGTECTHLPILSRNGQYSFGCLVVETGELTGLRGPK